MKENELQKLVKFCIKNEIICSYQKRDLWYRVYGICGQYIKEVPQKNIEKELMLSYQIFHYYITRMEIEKIVLNSPYRDFFLITQKYVKNPSYNIIDEKDNYSLKEFPYYQKIKPYIPKEYQDVYESLNGINTPKIPLKEYVINHDKYTEKKAYHMNQKVKSLIEQYHREEKNGILNEEVFFQSVIKQFEKKDTKRPIVHVYKNKQDFINLYKTIKRIQPIYFTEVEQVVFERCYPENKEARTMKEIGLSLKQLDPSYKGTAKEVLNVLKDIKLKTNEYYTNHQEEINESFNIKH